MSKYQVGVIPSSEGLVNFLWQSVDLGIEADNYAANDEDGNAADVKDRNHRARITISATIPKDAVIPVQGMVLQLKGIVLPTVSGDGVPTGGIKVSDAATTAIDFRVESCSISNSNSAYTTCSIGLVRYLQNGIAGDVSESA